MVTLRYNIQMIMIFLKTSIRHILTFLVLMCTALCCAARDSVSSYIPQVHGVVRGRWELDTEDGYSRFQIRNARVQVLGNVGPVFSYYINTDFCDRGKVEVKDAYIGAQALPWLSFRVGQFRQPFGMDSFRGPASQIFANRSFIGRYMANTRSVGVRAAFDVPTLPLVIEAGVFSPYSITEQNKWTRHYDYAARAIWKIASGPKIIGGFQSIIPDSIRINLWDIGASYSIYSLTFEAEYLYKHYTCGRHKAAHGYLVTADYSLPLKKSRTFNAISFQGRFEGMTRHSSGVRDANRLLADDNPARRRLTLGTTLTGDYGNKVFAALRLNYEKNFYDDGYKPSVDNSDRIVAELVVSF